MHMSLAAAECARARANMCAHSSLEEDFLAWKEQMWPAVCKQFNKDMEAASQSTYVKRAHRRRASRRGWC